MCETYARYSSADLLEKNRGARAEEIRIYSVGVVLKTLTNKTMPFGFRLLARRARIAILLARTATAIAVTAPSLTTLAAQSRPMDHAAFDALLHANVSRGMVDYDAFAKAPEFKAYLAKLAATDPATLPRADQLAFWINAYNAYTIQLINAHGERESIRNINKSYGVVKAYGPWKEKLARIGGKAYGLDEIEQDIIRKRYQEPRIHFALVCAAMGCPPLRGEAYVGQKIDAQLDEQAQIFLLKSPTKNRVDFASQTVYVSPIFVEFRDYIKDFGGSNASVGKFIAKFYPAGPERDLLNSGAFTVVKTNYDWSLNSKANAEKK